jgi:phosphotransferase system enzyme I (PtsP)
VNIKVITTSEIKISVLIDRKYMELAVQALHDTFELERPEFPLSCPCPNAAKATAASFCAACAMCWHPRQGAGPAGPRITHLIADSMGTEVCSIYLFRDPETLELCATEGAEEGSRPPDPDEAGRGAGRPRGPHRPAGEHRRCPRRKGLPLHARDGEEIYSSFLGVPIQRVGEKLGVLVVQSKTAREFSEDDIYALDVVAMVLAEMTELGAFTGDEGGDEGAAQAAGDVPRRHRARKARPRAGSGCTKPRVVVTNPVADDPLTEIDRIREAVGELRCRSTTCWPPNSWTRSRSRFWRPTGCSPIRAAGCAGWKRTSCAACRPRRRWKRNNPPPAPGWSRCRTLPARTAARSGRPVEPAAAHPDRAGQDTGAEMPDNPILVARNIGPAELLEYGRKLKGVVLEEGSVGSHAAIVARALAIPLVIHAAAWWPRR